MANYEAHVIAPSDVYLAKSLETLTTEQESYDTICCEHARNFSRSLSNAYKFIRSCTRDSNMIAEVRLIDQLIAKAKKIPSNTPTNADWDKVVECIVLLLWATSSTIKLNRKLIQLLGEIEKTFPEFVLSNIENHHVPLSSTSSQQDLSLWSGLITLTKCGRQLAKAQLDGILRVVAAQLEVFMSGGPVSWTVHVQEHTQALVKVLLDLLQHLKEPVRENLRGTEHHRTWQCVLSQLFTMLQMQTAPRDCCLLAGTIIVNLLILTHEDAACWAMEAHGLHHLLSKGGSFHLHNIIVQVKKPGSQTQTKTFGHLAVFSGILAMADSNSLCQNIIADSSQRDTTPGGGYQSLDNCDRDVSQDFNKEICDIPVPLMAWLHQKITALCYVVDFQYQAFRLLSQFFYKILKLFGTITNTLKYDMFHADSLLVTSTLNLIWTHLDSPVDGVNECILDIFKILLTLEQKERREESRSDLVDGLLGRILQVPWEVRARHNLIGVLINFADVIQVIARHPVVLADLPKCLSTNYLVPPAAFLYLSIITNISNLTNCETLWIKYCLPILSDAICSEQQLVRLNASQHLLPITFRKLPCSGLNLQNHLEERLSVCKQYGSEQRDRILHGYLAFLKTARNNQMLKHWPTDILQEALVHPQDSIRLDALSLLCLSPKTCEALSAVELRLLCSSLPYNMNIDEPPFRSQLQANIKQSVVRSRDAALAALRDFKKGKGGSEISDQTIDYIDWLWGLCLHELHPASNYQRQKTCLDWMSVVLDSLTPQPDRRKGGCPDQTLDLIKLAQSRGKWRLYTPRSTLTLLTCMLHDTDEIKQQGASLLERYFPWPLPFPSLPDSGGEVSLSGPKPADDYQVVPSGDCAAHPSGGGKMTSSGDPNESHMCRLLSQALRLCNSPRARECESGAVLCRLLFHKYILGGGHVFGVDPLSHGFQVVYIGNSEMGLAGIAWLDAMAQILEQSILSAKQSVLTAAREQPSHGLILACRQCISVCTSYVRDVDRWCVIARRLQKAATQIIELVLSVLGVNLKSQGAAPSFEQMGVAIQEVLANEQQEVEPETALRTNQVSDLADEEETNLSPDHQMVMTWCWLNIREASVLLSSLVQYLPISTRDSPGVLDITDVREAAETLVNVLTKCRHRGAIEGCNIGFLQLCRVLLTSKEQQLYNIPKQLLSKILGQIRELSQTSVTRRSAGLPLIVQSVIASEARTKQCDLLNMVITTLLSVISDPLPDSHNQQEDLPHVHALNILKAVLKESSVSQSVMSHIAPVTIIAVDLLSSPFWAVRNSAMQLYGTLQSRMLGQKKTADDSLNTTTAPEFFALYPGLYPYLMGKVKVAAAGLSTGQLTLHPSLCPVLSLLARLSPGLDNSHSQGLAEFREPIEGLTGSPLYTVRVLSCNALLALVTRQQALLYTQQIVKRLPDKQQDCTGYNTLHGQLLLLHMFISTYSESQTSEDLAQAVNSKQWLLSTENQCYMVKALFVRICGLLNGHGLQDVKSHLQALASENMESAEPLLVDGENVGYSDYMSAITDWGLKYHSCSLEGSLVACLQHPLSEVRVSCLSWLQQQAANINSQDWRRLQGILLKSLIRDMPWKELCLVLKLILEKPDCDLCELGQVKDQIWRRLLSIIERERGSLTAALALAVTAVLVRQFCKSYTSEGQACRDWSVLVEQCAQSDSSEVMREKAALALVITGRQLINALIKEGTVQHRQCVFNLLGACLRLLEDEHAEIRNAAARFISLLKDDTMPQPMHYNHALKGLMQYISSNLQSDVTTLEWIYRNMAESSLNLEQTIKHAQNKIISEQFEPSDLNPYEEAVGRNMHLLYCTQCLELQVTPLVVDWYKKKVADLSRKVIGVQNTLTAGLTDCDVLNITHHKPVYVGVHSLQCQALALIAWGQRLQVVDPVKVTEDCYRMLKVTGVHPCLSDPQLYSASARFPPETSSS